jgi:hypothetical protein
MGKLMQRLAKAAKSPFDEQSQLHSLEPDQKRKLGGDGGDTAWRRLSLEDSANTSSPEKTTAER